MNENKKISFTDNELSLISDIFHEYKDNHRGIKSDLLPVMEIEKKLSELSGQRYTPDTTYDWKDSRERETTRYGYVDLGLPSGILWANENVKNRKKDDKFLSFDEALEDFGDKLPTKEDWEELIEHSRYEWNAQREGYDITGPNGNSIFLPATGIIIDDIRLEAGDTGRYWSGTPDEINETDAFYLFFGPYGIDPANYGFRHRKFTIRLCKRPMSSLK